MFKHQLLNEPGSFPSELLALGRHSANDFVFAQGCRLQPHTNSNSSVEKHESSGDGAWIMQKCAKTMAGLCHIMFEPMSTTFTFECPAEPELQTGPPPYLNFEVPSNTWAIAFDDTKIQLKIMHRLLGHIGVHESQCLLMGCKSADVELLEPTLLDLMAKNKDSKVLILMDELLDYNDISKGYDNNDGVYSGSLLLEQIISRLPAEYCSRLLAVMRSANDSAMDIAMYTSRTHGYFPKAVMQSDRTREIFYRLWNDHFEHPESAPKRARII